MAKITEGKKIAGVAGNGTEVIFELEESDKPQIAGTVAMWFFDCPGQSAVWRHYMLSIVHLRPIENVPPAHISRTGATHEMILAALDPSLKPLPTDPRTWKWLTPLNYVGQLRLPSDGAAKSVLADLASCIAEGRLWAEPLLSGQIEPWESHVRRYDTGSLAVKP